MRTEQEWLMASFGIHRRGSMQLIRGGWLEQEGRTDAHRKNEAKTGPGKDDEPSKQQFRPILRISTFSDQTLQILRIPEM